ncbi:MAG: MaoC family dehydratase N-terminal domain-containing protein [Chloroflexi bacterium]|nr:MaoC family dehydratase N-terminal domain-containing protein [Chloroflexota bacterium]
MMTRHAVMTDEMLAEVKSHIGEPWNVTGRSFQLNRCATEDTIRHFANAIGDPNPLYHDPEYGKKTRWGRMVAPPCFLYSIHWAAGHVPGMKGIHGWHSGNYWEFYKPIYDGDCFDTTQTVTRIDEKSGRMSRRLWIVHADSEYVNQRGELVARTDGWTTWAERGEAGKSEKYKGITEATYTPEELGRIEEECLSEEIRGAKPRYWEDVNIGDVLKPVVKGPLSMRDMYAYLQGLPSPYIKAHGIYLRYRGQHPEVEMVDSETGRRDVPELVHQESSRAREIGAPGAYDYGCQRISWLGHLLTNWMGDDGFVKKLYAEIRRFNVIGDTTWCKGKVTKKYVENGEHLVDIEIRAENQRGEVTAPGWATVQLPSKAAS